MINKEPKQEIKKDETKFQHKHSEPRKTLLKEKKTKSYQYLILKIL